MSEAATVRRLQIGAVIGDAWGVFARNWAVVGGLAMLLAFLPTFGFGLLRVTGVVADPGTDAMAAMRGAPGEVIVTTVTGVLLQGALLAVCLEDLAGRSADMGDAFARAGRHFWRLLGLSILINLGVALGLVLLIVPGVLLYLRWMAAPAAQIAESAGMSESMARSVELTHGNRWVLFGLTMIGVVGLVGAVVLLGLAVTLLGDGTRAALIVQNLVVDPLSAVLIGVVGTLGMGAAYARLAEARGDQRTAEVFA